MKKAKIVLSAIALFAVVGGALAFKANKFGLGTMYYAGTSTITTAVGGPVYYIATTNQKDYVTTNIGNATLFYQATTTVTKPGITYTVFALPTTTRGTTVLP